MARRRKTAQAGVLFRIVTKGGHVGYGRKLQDSYAEFFNLRVAEGDPDPTPSELFASGVAFRIAIADVVGYEWPVIGMAELDASEINRTFLFVKQDPINGRVSIYWRKPIDRSIGERRATLEECAGLETAALWQREHVEQRLIDSWAGVPNATTESLRPK